MYLYILLQFLAKVSTERGAAGYLLRSALSSKLRNLRVLGVTKHSVWDALVFSKAKTAMGLNRVRLMISGGAPLPAKTMEVSIVVCN
jgi:long-subunit acyl-CoA synthetase (AMP-forming)